MDLLVRIDEVLRPARSVAVGIERVWLRNVGLMGMAMSVAYGGVMGSRGLLAGLAHGTFDLNAFLQMLISASKVPMLLVITFILSVPSFFILNTLAGLRGDFGDVIRALARTQAGMSAILLSLAPFTILWYVTSSNYESAIIFNAAMFTVASIGSRRLLRREYAPLIERNPRHRSMLRVWLFLYAFVGIQLGWMLRPFIGAPNRPAEFIRPDSWGNAYVMVIETLMRM